VKTLAEQKCMHMSACPQLQDQICTRQMTVLCPDENSGQTCNLGANAEQSGRCATAFCLVSGCFGYKIFYIQIDILMEKAELVNDFMYINVKLSSFLRVLISESTTYYNISLRCSNLKATFFI